MSTIPRYLDIDHVNDFICHNHEDIQELCKDIRLKLNSNEGIPFNSFEFEKIIKLIEIIEDRAKQAKYQGQVMEDRLKDYRKAIEKLGYARVNKYGV